MQFRLKIYGRIRAIGGRSLGVARYAAKKYGDIDCIVDTKTGDEYAPTKQKVTK